MMMMMMMMICIWVQEFVFTFINKMPSYRRANALQEAL